MTKLIPTAFLGLVLAVGSQAQVVVRIGPPPPPRREVIIPRPGPGFVWRAGFYRYDGRGYVWVPGEWVSPPRREFRHWVPGHWRRVRDGHVWIEGHWAR
jgi:hypothetical protein